MTGHYTSMLQKQFQGGSWAIRMGLPYFLALALWGGAGANAAESTPTNRSFRWSWETEGAANLPAEPNPIKQPVSDPNRYESIVKENLALRSELTRLLKMNIELKQAQSDFDARLAEGEKQRAALLASMKEIKTPNEMYAELAKVKGEKSLLEKEIERLKQSVATNPPPAPLSPPRPEPLPGSDLFKRIERENMELRAELVTVKNAQRQAEESRRKVEAEDQAKRGRLEQTLQEKSALAGKLDQLQDGQVQSERQVETLTKKSKNLQEENRTLVTRIAELEKEIRQLRADRAKTSSAASTGAGAPTPGQARTNGPPVTVEPVAQFTSTAAAGLRLAQQGKYREAEKMFLKALSENPADATIHFNLGLLYDQGLNSPAKALLHYKRYLELQPNAADAGQVRAWVLELEMGVK